MTRFKTLVLGISFLAGMFGFLPAVAAAQVYQYDYLYGQTQYQYPYYQNYPIQQLTCIPSTQVVQLGSTATFRAYGGYSGPYTWTTSERTYYNIGETLNAVFTILGTQTITVTSGVQTATCSVTVVQNSPYPTYPPTYPAYQYPTVYTQKFIPALPNTGFKPISTMEMALAFALLVAVGIFATPYVKRTITTTLS